MNLATIPLSGSKIYLGHMPRSSAFYPREFENLKDKNIHTVLLLSTEEDLIYYQYPQLPRLYKRLGFRVIHYPIEDFWVPEDIESFDNLINYMLALIRSGENVLIHCNAGLGRTGLVVCSLLIKLGLNTDSALNYARKYRRGLVETPYQIQFLRRYERMIKNGKLNN